MTVVSLVTLDGEKIESTRDDWDRVSPDFRPYLVRAYNSKETLRFVWRSKLLKNSLWYVEIERECEGLLRTYAVELTDIYKAIDSEIKKGA